MPDSRAWFRLHDPRLWHYQTMRTQETRAWLYWRSKDQMQKDRHLTPKDVNWLMDEEDNETTLLKFAPASGGRPSEWRIRQGNYSEGARRRAAGACRAHRVRVRGSASIWSI